MIGPFVFFLCGAAVTGLAALGRHRSTREASARSSLRRQGRTSIREARGGDAVKVVGAVRHLRAPLRSPLGDLPCAGYEVVIEAWGELGWTELAREEHTSDFLVDDGTAVALVKASGADLALARRLVPADGEAYPRIVDLVARHDHEGLDRYVLVPGTHALRFREAIIQEGDRVAVRGVGCWERDPAAYTYRDLAERLVVRAPQGDRVLIGAA
jgi:hypothetical protein